jgi:predicted nucleotidyltransferase
MPENFTVLFECVSGSRLYGLHGEDSDFDYRGICFPPEDSMLGLKSFEQHEEKDPDRVVYSLRKFINLALQNNPNILELLYVPSENIKVRSRIYDQLCENRERFLSKRIFKSYMGYAQAQLHRLDKCHVENMTSKRKENVEKFGYDTKAAMHLFRLLFQCKELGETRTLTLPLTGDKRKLLLDVKTGAFALEGVKWLAHEYFFDLREYVEAKSSLPADPDFNFWNEFCVNAHKEFYNASKV